MNDKVMNHATYQKNLKYKSNLALQFIIKDAQEAIAANPTNPNNGFYADEVCYAAAELRKRGA